MINYIKINKNSVEKFILDLRKEDAEELKFFFNEKYKNVLFNALLDDLDKSYMLADGTSPIAVGGVCKSRLFNTFQNSGCVWLLCTNRAKFYKKELYSHIKFKIDLFKKDYDILFNYIYKTNFNALKWLQKLDFKVKDTAFSDIKLFYYSKGGTKIDL